MVTGGKIAGSLISRFASRLRFPQLFFVTLALFLIDLVFPDLVPFVDEIVLGLLTLLLGSWSHDRGQDDSDDGPKPPVKDITPTEPEVERAPADRTRDSE